MPLGVTAKVTRSRSRLIETVGEIHAAGDLICSATGKYFPLGAAETGDFLKTFVDEPGSAQTAGMLRGRIVV
jgi:hypothetical protein